MGPRPQRCYLAPSLVEKPTGQLPCGWYRPHRSSERSPGPGPLGPLSTWGLTGARKFPSSHTQLPQDISRVALVSGVRPWAVCHCKHSLCFCLRPWLLCWWRPQACPCDPSLSVRRGLSVPDPVLRAPLRGQHPPLYPRCPAQTPVRHHLPSQSQPLKSPHNPLGKTVPGWPLQQCAQNRTPPHPQMLLPDNRADRTETVLS